MSAHIVEISPLDLIRLCAVEHDIDQLGHEDVKSKPNSVNRNDFVRRQVQNRGGRNISPVNIDKSKEEPEEARNRVTKDKSTGQVDDIKVDEDIGDGWKEAESILMQKELSDEQIEHAQERRQSKSVFDRGLEGSSQSNDRLNTESDPFEAGREGGDLAVEGKHDHVEGDEVKQFVVHREEQFEVILEAGGQGCGPRGRGGGS